MTHRRFREKIARNSIATTDDDTVRLYGYAVLGLSIHLGRLGYDADRCFSDAKTLLDKLDASTYVEAEDFLRRCLIDIVKVLDDDERQDIEKKYADILRGKD